MGKDKGVLMAGGKVIGRSLWMKAVLFGLLFDLPCLRARP